MTKDEIILEALKTIPGTLSVIDTDYNIQLVGGEIARTLENIGQVIGKKCYEVFQERDNPCPWCKIDRVMKTGDIINETTTPDDPREKLVGKPLAVYLRPLKDKNGDTIGAIELGTDITPIRQAEEKSRQAEEALRQERDLVQKYLEVAGSIIVVIGADQKVCVINAKACEVLGYEAEEVIGRNWFDNFLPERVREVLRSGFIELMSKPGKGIKDIFEEGGENPVMTRHGTERTVAWHNTVLRDEKGNVTATVSSGEDVTEVRRAEAALRKVHEDLERRVQERTIELAKINEELRREVQERKQAEEALRESEQKFRGLAEQSPNMIFINKGGRVVYANRRCEEVMGYKREEFCSPDFDFRTLIAPESTGMIERAFAKHMQGEEIAPYEYGLITRDGRRIEAINSSKLITFEGAKAILGVVTDITERKRAEETLRKSEARYRAVVQDQTELICRFTPDGKLSFVNDVYCRYFGKDADELVGHAFMPMISEEDREMVKTHLASIDRENPVSTLEHRVMSPDGEIRWQRWTNRAIFDNSGHVVEFQAVGRDVTERKRTEAQLQQAQRMESIGTLAGGIAHDFNNILMGVQGNVSMMLLDVDEADPHYERLKNMERQVQSGARLTSHLLAYARKGKYEVKPFSLNQLVEEACYTFGRARKEVTIHQHLSADAYAIEGDPGQIEQVLLNLFVNSAEAMPDGGDFILETMNVTHKDMTGRLYKPKRGNYVLLRVTDTGAGMDKKTVDRIFEPFFTTKEMGRGTGLGLASAYGIIKAHEGYIDVDSRKGRGTTFSIYLPASEKEALRTVRASDSIINGTETVLLVDDEEVVREASQELLEAMGYRVLIAKDGKEAVELYKNKQEDIDIVLLDIVMPNMGGREAYETLKSINPDIRVLLLSGYSIDGQATEILKRGANAFIQKPFNMKELSGKIREVLDKE
jgi:two-component system cell cycle sensor histidine kinase/response regulator CckA